MSHITETTLEIRNLDLLAQACEAVGCELVRDQKTVHSYQSGLRCDHAVRVIGNRTAYEATVRKSPCGKFYTLGFDDFGPAGRALEERIGPGAERLANHYGARVAVKRMQSKGFRVTITEDQDGVRAVCRK